MKDNIPSYLHILAHSYLKFDICSLVLDVEYDNASFNVGSFGP